MNKKRLIKTLERDEGYRKHPYLCTAGKETIGLGRNIQDKGISYSEAIFLLKNDINEAIDDLRKIFKQFNELPDHIQEILVNMRFQMGSGGFRSFTNMIAAVNAWDFEKMKIEMLDSKWAKKDTPERARRLVEFVSDGFNSSQ